VAERDDPWGRRLSGQVRVSSRDITRRIAITTSRQAKPLAGFTLGAGDRAEHPLRRSAAQHRDEPASRSSKPRHPLVVAAHPDARALYGDHVLEDLPALAHSAAVAGRRPRTPRSAARESGPAAVSRQQLLPADPDRGGT
jgi:hypothetical protein